MPDTFLGLPFDADIFNSVWASEPDPVKTVMLNSGALVEDAVIAEMIKESGNLYTLPFYETLDGEPDNYDGETDINSTETSSSYQTGVVFGRAKGFTARNFVAELTGADPMGNITSNIARYWQKQDQTRLLLILNALFNISGTSGNAKKWHDNHIFDLSSSTEAPYKIGVTDLNDVASSAAGDNKSIFSLAIMHSHVARTLENLQLLEYWKFSDPNGLQRSVALGHVNGYSVLVDDSVPASPVGGSSDNKALTKYTTYLLGNGAIRMAKGRVDVPSEIERVPAFNGGQETLYTRTRKTFHPNGFSFSVPAAGWTGSPTDEQLGDVSNWEIKFDPKTIPIAALITNG